MFVKEYGSGGRQFLCLHGWGGDHREFSPLASCAPNEVTLLSVDLPGYGLSPKPDEWSLDTISDQVLNVLKVRAVERCVLIGFCSGAGLALMLAEKVPDKIRRVIMIDPFAFIPWYFRLFLYGTFGRNAYAITFQTKVGRKITDWILKRFQNSDADFTKAFVNLDHEVTLRYLHMLSRVNIHQQFKDLNMDIDILYGENTFTSVVRSVNIFQSLLPQIKVKELKGLGHLPMIKGARQLASFIFEDLFADDLHGKVLACRKRVKKP
ncbi:MAG: alpha/beta hydrolase [Thermodesulfobacteriota bacterium]|nr:alpha/beta hydrolase [Thermodesulfobacteriota bacterium]